MRIRTLLTTAAVSAALVAGGVAGPAMAADPVIAAGAVGIDAPAAIAMSSFDKPVTNVSIAGTGSYVHFYLLQNGAWVETYKTFLYGAYGSASTTEPLDLVGAIQGGYTSASKPLAAGTYSYYLSVDANSTYTNGVSTSYSAAQTAAYTLNVSKISSKITGWKAVSKKAKYGKLIKLSSPKLTGVGPDTKIVLQYRKKGSKKWKTSESSATGSYFPTNYNLKTQAFNKIAGKRAKKGTYYIRVMIKGSAYVTGAVTKQATVRWY